MSFWTQMVQLSLKIDNKTHGGSRPGRSAKISWNFAEAHYRYMLKYFWQSHLQRPETHEYGPIHTDQTFKRRFSNAQGRL